jgi:hypothetical protein
MRVDDGPAVLPARCGGQIAKHGHDLSLPLSAVQVSVSPGGRCRSAGGVPASRVLAASCVLAALCFGQVWFGFVARNTANLSFYQGVPPGAASARQFAALLANTALLTGCFVVLWRLAWTIRRSQVGEMATDTAFLLVLAIPANAIRGILQPVVTGLNLAYWLHLQLQGFVWSAFGAGLAVVLYWRRPLARLACRVLILLFPLVPFMLAEASWVLLRSPSPASPGVRRPAGPAGAGRHGPRVVWMIFDKMDYRLAFESPTNSQLPEFNELARASLFAVKAYPPGGRTAVSVPALLAGRLVTGSEVTGESDLLVRYEGSQAAVRWSVDQTIFADDRQKGWRAGLAGWYFPYARIFGSDIDAWQLQDWRLGLNPNRPFAGLMTDQFRVLVESKSRSLLGRPLLAVEHRRVVGEIVAEAAHKAADPALDLVFLHLPVPHQPYYYDARTGQDASRPQPVQGYLDHLQLGDHILGQIRRAVKEAGLAGRTTLLISSDHWHQEADLIDGRIDHRVPFLVNFPGDEQGSRYTAPFNTVLSRRLVTAIMNGEIHSAAGAAAWMDREKGVVTESPYNGN